MLAVAIRIFGFLVGSAAVAATTDFERELVLTPHVGDRAEDTEIVRWQQAAQQGSGTRDALTRLGWAYVSKARRTLDAGFYKLAEKTIDVAERQFSPNADTRVLRGHVWHNLHRFTEAEEIARELVAERGAPAELALLSDVLVEQGKLVEAVAVVQRLADTKPGAEANVRIAHLRWLKGEMSGAVAAMTAAAAAISARDVETDAWIHTRLSGLWLQVGDLTRAGRCAEQALARVADFAPALLAHGRVLFAQSDAVAAVEVLERAAALNPLPEYQWWLADGLRALGRDVAAAKIEARIESHGAANDPRTLALFLATRGERIPTAVRLAREELAYRQDVFTYDAVAWASAAAGDLAAADDAMRAALAENTCDARLFLHAGEIARRCGRLTEAARHFAAAHRAAPTLTPSEHALLKRRLTATLEASSQNHP